MVSILILIDRIKKNPRLYLGRSSILLFQAYLYGWIHRDEKLVEDIDSLSFFQDWICEKYFIKSSHSWADIILFYELEESKALEKFFELWDEFLLENRPS